MMGDSGGGGGEPRHLPPLKTNTSLSSPPRRHQHHHHGNLNPPPPPQPHSLSSLPSIHPSVSGASSNSSCVSNHAANHSRSSTSSRLDCSGVDLDQNPIDQEVRSTGNERAANSEGQDRNSFHVARLCVTGYGSERGASVAITTSMVGREGSNSATVNHRGDNADGSNVKTGVTVEDRMPSSRADKTDTKLGNRMMEDEVDRKSPRMNKSEPCSSPVYLSQPCFPQNEARTEYQAVFVSQSLGDNLGSKTNASGCVDQGATAALPCKSFTLTLSSNTSSAFDSSVADPTNSDGVVAATPSTQHSSLKQQSLSEGCRSTTAEESVSQVHEGRASASDAEANMSAEKDDPPAASDHTNCGSPPPDQSSSASQFVITPNIYSDSDTDEYSDFDRKPAVGQGKVEVENDAPIKTVVPRGYDARVQENDSKNGVSDVDSKAGIAMLKESSRLRSKRKKTKSKVSVKKESDIDDGSASDYEPPLPHKAKERTANRVLPTRNRRRTVPTSYLECSDDSDDATPTTLNKVRRAAQPVRKRAANTRTENCRQKSTAVHNKPGNKTCPECHKTFTRAESLTIHMRVHTGERPFQCQQCDATYKVSSHLRNHVRSKHSSTKEYQCATCSKAFSTPNAKGRHEKTCGKDLSERVKFHCPRCSKGFVTAEGFERHKNMDSCCAEELGAEPPVITKRRRKEETGDDGAKSEEKPFKCPKCGKAFGEFTSLDCHQRFICGKARGTAPHICPQCSRPFTKWNRYVAHSRRHAGDRPFPCKYCDSRFFDRESLRKHVARHEGKNRVTCSLCDKIFSAKGRLSMHIMRFHCGMKPYKCNECDSDFASAKLLSTHIRRVHRKEKRFKCQLCDKAFFESQAWMKHMVMHAGGKDPSVRGPVQEYPCNLCGKVMNMRLMRLHVEAEHPGVQLSEAVTKDMVTCKLCMKEFSDSSSLKIHMIRHTGKKDFKCDQCEMAFVTIHALQIHQRKHTDTRPYSCEECGETFRWRASLRDHKINHHNPDLETADGDGRKFTCQECGQRFKRFNSLKSHMIRHRSVMPCICSECGKGFTDTTRLKIHMSCHSGSDRPFICETCGAGFFYTFLLKRHIQSRHKPSPWLCNLCGRSLCSKDALKRHIQHHANSPDGKVRVGGNRGRTRKPKETAESRPKAKGRKGKNAQQVDDNVDKQPQQDCAGDAREEIGNRLEPLPPAADSQPAGRDYLDISRPSNNDMQPNCSMFVEQNYPYPSAGYIMNPVLWPKPEQDET